MQITGSEFISEGTILLEKSGAHHHRILSNDSGNDLAFQQSSDTGANTNFTTYLRINDGGNISLPVDNQRLRLGASADLELFHNGSHSYIQDNGTGALYIGSNGGGVYVRGQHGEESIIANSNGAVELYLSLIQI